MEIRRCEKGHFYDAEANSVCPQCEAETKTSDSNISVSEKDTMPKRYRNIEDDFPPSLYCDSPNSDSNISASEKDTMRNILDAGVYYGSPNSKRISKINMRKKKKKII